MDLLDDMRIDYLYDRSSEIKGDKNRRLRWDFQVSYMGKRIGFIEYDGRQHFTPVAFGKTGAERKELAAANFEVVKRYDQLKDEYCKKNNISLLRIPYTNFKLIDEIVVKWIIDNSDWGIEYEKLEEFTQE
jgi:hypothetical protein